MKVTLSLLSLCAYVIVGSLSQCTGPSCAPEVGSIHRPTASKTGTGCSAVLLSGRIILSPADCLYDVKNRRRHKNIRFVQGSQNVSVTQVALADATGSKSLAVGLLQSTSGKQTSGLEWSARSVEDLDPRVALPGNNT